LNKIGFLLPHLEDGGIPKIASNISLNIDDKYEQYVITLIKNFDINYEFDAELVEIEGIGKNFISKLVVFFRRVRKVRKVKKELNLDVVISFGVAANIVNILSKNNEKIICTEHNIKSIENKSWGFFGIIYDFLIKIFYKRSNEIIAISKMMKRDLKNHYSLENNIKVIYNPHDINDIINKSNEKIEKKYEDLLEKDYIVAIGKTQIRKGFWHLIKVLKKLHEEFPHLHLIILGPKGEIHDQIVKLVTKLNIEDKVHFLGFQDNPYKFIAKANLFVMTSLNEGLPNVIIESLALETPVISTDCISGPREILQKDPELDKSISNYQKVDYGILIPELKRKPDFEDCDLEETEEILFEAIKELLKDKELYNRYKNKSLGRARDFDVSKVIKKYEALL